ncbi:LysR substrate-binding domain-containing protein [Cupriavidus sp. TMH.W2]|uniref:LysR substrate-binding domain-containing protein n=1 Tax=Cupriavidus sp. TMH.W2 TaxID=3434465 RepID=UPI003D77267B
MFRLPPLNYLRTFEAAARHLSFTQAADELNCTQASVSQQIRALEHFIGKPLFQRLPRGIVLTEVGQAYLPAVQASIQYLAAATVGLVGRARTQNLVISSPVAFGSCWLAQHIQQFCAQHPNVNVTVNCTIWDDPSLESADLFIRLGSGNWHEMRSKRLTRERALVACSPELLHGENALKRPEDIKRHRLIHVLSRQDNWSRWAAAQDVHNLEKCPAIWADNSIVALELAASGAGLALTLETFVAWSVKRQAVACPFSEALDIQQGHFLLRPLNKPSNSVAEAFMDWLPGIE